MAKKAPPGANITQIYVVINLLPHGELSVQEKPAQSQFCTFVLELFQIFLVFSP